MHRADLSLIQAITWRITTSHKHHWNPRFIQHFETFVFVLTTSWPWGDSAVIHQTAPSGVCCHTSYICTHLSSCRSTLYRVYSHCW